MNCLQFNLSHHVGHLSFGLDYPGQVNPLDGTEQFAKKGGYSNILAVFAVSAVLFNSFLSETYMCSPHPDISWGALGY